MSRTKLLNNVCSVVAQANTCAECAGAIQGLHVRRVTAETTRCSAALTFDTLNCPFLAASASFTRSTDTMLDLPELEADSRTTSSAAAVATERQQSSG